MSTKKNAKTKKNLIKGKAQQRAVKAAALGHVAGGGALPSRIQANRDATAYTNNLQARQRNGRAGGDPMQYYNNETAPAAGSNTARWLTNEGQNPAEVGNHDLYTSAPNPDLQLKRFPTV